LEEGGIVLLDVGIDAGHLLSNGLVQRVAYWIA
jgi:hypothetical protein